MLGMSIAVFRTRTIRKKRYRVPIEPLRGLCYASQMAGPSNHADPKPFPELLRSALQGEYDLVIDARSEREFSEDHLPGNGQSSGGGE